MSAGEIQTSCPARPLALRPNSVGMPRPVTPHPLAPCPVGSFAHGSHFPLAFVPFRLVLGPVTSRLFHHALAVFPVPLPPFRIHPLAMPLSILSGLLNELFPMPRPIFSPLLANVLAILVAELLPLGANFVSMLALVTLALLCEFNSMPRSILAPVLPHFFATRRHRSIDSVPNSKTFGFHDSPSGRK